VQICKTCKKEKPYSEYSPRPYKGSLYKKNGNLRTTVVCKECIAEAKKNIYRTKEGLIRRIYLDQIGNSKKRKMSLPEYSLEELSNWVLQHSQFTKLFNIWVNSGYDRLLRPSCDRVEDTTHYTLENIRLTTFKINAEKECVLHKQGKSRNKDLRAVDMFDLSGNYLASFISQAEAERITGANQQNISSCCRGLLRQTKGYKWSYSNQSQEYFT
jgi:hypothetical protein